MSNLVELEGKNESQCLQIVNSRKFRPKRDFQNSNQSVMLRTDPKNGSLVVNTNNGCKECQILGSC